MTYGEPVNVRADRPEGACIVLEIEGPAPDRQDLLDRSNAILACPFADLQTFAQLVAMGDDPRSAAWRISVNERRDGVTRLEMIAAESLLTPFEQALACRAVAAAFCKQDIALNAGSRQDHGNAPGLASVDFGYIGAEGSRAELDILGAINPSRLARAVAQVAEIWSGRDQPVTALVIGNVNGRPEIQSCSATGETIALRGSANAADIMCCIETPGAQAEAGAMFRASLVGEMTTLNYAGRRINICGCAILRRKAALTVFVRQSSKGTALTLISGRRGLPAELANWFLSDIDALLSGTEPCNQDVLPSIRKRRKMRGPKRENTRAAIALLRSIGTLWQGFEITCLKYPDRIALHDDKRNVDYATLRDHALRLGATLVTSTAPMAPVALLCEHGAIMVTAMLATLAAGRPYVPLDPDYPKAYLAYMLKASGATQLLSDPINRDLAAQIAPEGCDVEWLNAEPKGEPAIGMPHEAASPNDPAYILFTSGSTGTPKCVVQSHQNVLLQIRNHINVIGIEPKDRISVVSSFSFDASVTDTYGALLSGAMLVPVNARRLGLAQVARCMQKQAVSVWHSTPTVFRHMVDALDGHQCLPKMRCVILGGEPVFARDVSAIAHHCASDVKFVNGYGATEASFITQNTLRVADYDGPDIVPIGWPIAGFDVDLVDASGHTVPVIGELTVSTSHFAIDSSETAKGQMVCHRTGDLARFDPDTGFSYIGRCGPQIKLRGYRIDPAQIEQILRRQHGVSDVCVIVRSDPHVPDSEVLCAYIAIQGAPPRKAALAQAVQTQLPAYMVPTYYTFLPNLPLTQSGKIDRKRMPDPDLTPDPAELDHYMASSTLLHDGLRHLFGIENYNPEATFFDLGLTSLSLAILHAYLTSRTDIPLSLIDLFELGTPTKVIQMLNSGGAETRDGSQTDTLVSMRTHLKKRRRKRADL